MDAVPMNAVEAIGSREPTGAGAGTALARAFAETVGPILVVLGALIVIWYAAALWLNAPWAYDQAQRAGAQISIRQVAASAMWQERPVLPAPHQVAAELWDTVVAKPITSRRSLVYHAWVTLSATLLGFVLGTTLGVLLATLIVHNVAADKSLMPWIVATQTVPILAIAPMIIVVLNAIGVTGLLPKALISTYLSFFPVVVGMVKGLRSPEPFLLDLMRSYNASTAQTFWKLRWPSALPYLFTSMKVAVAISLVGAIVGELPTGAVAGLGARLLAGSYYGQTIQIWSALFMAAALAATLVALVGLAHRLVLRRMGMATNG
jgi:NitT/TauT family transport system permease protein